MALSYYIPLRGQVIFRVFVLVFLASLFFGCSEDKKVLTPEMELMAQQKVINYLERNDLPIENLITFKSKASPKPDFAFLYTGGDRCIEFIVYCNGHSCNELNKYPFDKHGEKCPR